ncbi:MAG: arginyl-tRNA synthetase [Patescibacteria group bacterium]|jgi:arginyl-tRNA synthetase|nr:arginyl-tRNA synthetase [Patescibacteria group bacterium]
MYALATAKKEAYTALKKALGKQAGVTVDMLLTPPKPEYGDLSFPCFELAKGLKRNPAEIAAEVAAKIGPSKLISRITSVGPYVNFTFDDAAFAAHILSDVLKLKGRYGKSTTGKGKKVLIEYANPNTHKEIHVGHLRNFSLGAAIVNILRFNGYEVVPVSYINDLGNNVAKCLWGLEKLHAGEEAPAENRLNYLGKIYAEANTAIGEDDARKAEVSEIQRQLELMEGEWVPLWKKTQKWSLEGLKEIFDQFGLELAHIYLEHDLINDTHEIVKRLLTEGVAKMSEGAVIVDLEEQGLGVNLLRKSDGTLLYNAKDLALAFKKEGDYDADRLMIIVDNRQSLAMRQLIATLKLMNFPGDVQHLSYDMVTLPDGAMSSRKGNIVRWTDMYDAMFTNLVAETSKRHPDWSARKISANAKALAIASVKFVMLRQDPEKVLTFDMEEAMAAEGYTAPYILYTVARIYTLLNKAEIAPEERPELLVQPIEQTLLKLVAKFPDIVQLAGATSRASVIAQYAFELSQEFARYYEVVRILDDVNHDRVAARLGLLDVVRQTLSNAMSTLGIQVVKEM